MRNSTVGLGLDIDALSFLSICRIRHASHRRAYGTLAFTLVRVDIPFANFGLSIAISSTSMASFVILLTLYLLAVYVQLRQSRCLL
jgi:hypothetical protein